MNRQYLLSQSLSKDGIVYVKTSKSKNGINVIIQFYTLIKKNLGNKLDQKISL